MKKLIFSAGLEGGGVAIYRENLDGNEIYRYVQNEMGLDHDEEISLHHDIAYPSFEEAFERMHHQYKWNRWHILATDDSIASYVEEKRQENRYDPDWDFEE